MGIRTGAVHVVPFADVLNTMSFELQPVRKRQSDQATNTLPAPSIPAVGRFGLRIPPASRWLSMDDTSTLLPHELPPLVDVKALMPDPSKGTTTVPFGCTSGSPPKPKAWSDDPFPAPQVMPPSLETLIRTSPVPYAWSHSV